MGRVGVIGLFCLVALYLFVEIVGDELKPLFVNCGSNSTTNADGRVWLGDSVPGTNVSLSYRGSVIATSEVRGESLYGSLYETARVFNASSKYEFPVVVGSYYIRFHFYPIADGNFNANESIFSVVSNSLKLVSKYSVSEDILRKNSNLESRGSNSTITSLVKEYFLNISSDELTVEFIPESGSVAFINAIEIIPVLDEQFFELATKVGDNGGKSSLNLAGLGLETMYRLNVGGPEIKSSEDRDCWRTWGLDDIYMFSNDTTRSIKNSSNISYSNKNDSSVAPLMVYTGAGTTRYVPVAQMIFNMSWKFDVNPGFDYLVRLHFCELKEDAPGQRVFRIYMDFKTAALNYDVFAQAGGKNKAYHDDYVVGISPQTFLLWLQLGPDISSSYPDNDAILNGIEIFKLSKDGNLAYTYRKIDKGSGDGNTNHLKNKKVLLAVCVGVASVFVFSGACMFFFCFCAKKSNNEPPKDNAPRLRPLVSYETMGSTNGVLKKMPASSANGSGATTRMGRRFTLREIVDATKNFDESLVIGSGGFGKVYKGEIEEHVCVAVKRAHPHSQQGLAEFDTEIQMLSRLRHRHLVCMIGYCDEQGEMILVYEYMANGTLRSHLFGCDSPPLSWKQRLDACIGAARGLHYLHTGADRGIIHRDVKSTNILLDENFVAKVADFGLSKMGPALDHTHVSTAVKGSFGYLDPEYFRRQQLTQKSDVYSFGVVLFEVVCARPVIQPGLPKDQINLAEWALKWQKQGSIDAIVDPRLAGNYSFESMRKFGEVAEKCLEDDGKNRPTIGEVLWHLESVTQLQEEYVKAINGDSSIARGRRSNAICPGLPLIQEEDEAARPRPMVMEESSLLSLDSMRENSYN